MTFEQAVEIILRWEGGEVNDPRASVRRRPLAFVHSTSCDGEATYRAPLPQSRLASASSERRPNSRGRTAAYCSSAQMPSPTDSCRARSARSRPYDQASSPAVEAPCRDRTDQSSLATPRSSECRVRRTEGTSRQPGCSSAPSRVTKRGTRRSASGLLNAHALATASRPPLPRGSRNSGFFPRGVYRPPHPSDCRNRIDTANRPVGQADSRAAVRRDGQNVGRRGSSISFGSNTINGFSGEVAR
jgi:hypothetical protein